MRGEMCGPTDAELMKYVYRMLEFNREARLRGKYKPACRVCAANLMYLAAQSSGMLGVLSNGLLKAGKETGIDDPSCIGLDLSMRYFAGLDKSERAKKAYEHYISIGRGG